MLAHVSSYAKPRASCHLQIEDVAVRLAEMGRRADWLSSSRNIGVRVATVRERWEAHLKTPKRGAKEADRLAARKYRLVSLFGSVNCYSANVHAKAIDLGELVYDLVRLDRVSAHTSAEGLKLLVQAWDEHLRWCKEWLPWHGLRSRCSNLLCVGVMWPSSCSSKGTLACAARHWACSWCQ